MTNPATPSGPTSSTGSTAQPTPAGTGSAPRPVPASSTNASRPVAQPTAPAAVERFDPRTPGDRFTRAKGELEAQDAIMRKRLTQDQYDAWRTAEDKRLADVAALDAEDAQRAQQ